MITEKAQRGDGEKEKNERAKRERKRERESSAAIAQHRRQAKDFVFFNPVSHPFPLPPHNCPIHPHTLPEVIKRFLIHFSTGLPPTKPYFDFLRNLKDRDPVMSPILTLHLDDLSSWEGIPAQYDENGDETVPAQNTGDRGFEISARANANTLRYIELISQALDSLLEDDDQLVPNPSLVSLNKRRRQTLPETVNSSGHSADRDDYRDTLNEQRLAADRSRVAAANLDGPAEGVLANDPSAASSGDKAGGYPPALMRRYELRLLPSRSARATHGSLRDIKSSSIGRLVTVSGLVIRTSDVKPICEVATYTCDRCGFELFHVVANSTTFTPRRRCWSPKCAGNGPNGVGVNPDEAQLSSRGETLHQQTRFSKFTKFQEVKLQELPSQVPIGHIPRSLTIHCVGELTRSCSPGDSVTVVGVFLPLRYEGFKAMRSGLSSDTYLLASDISVHKKSYDENSAAETDPQKLRALDAAVAQVATAPDPVGRISRSIAPEIFGHEDVKRALLLQLVGGCERVLPDGMRIRGDLNICLMGDPGVAKSQLLKFVSSFAPRGVYTTGKGSSGVGLTAAITKDLTTGEMALEGGALVLADKGICCIDEFDKMEEGDRTAIHEVMEQQTVSIAKAGITATLNARAAVLAAANPLYGRYNRRKSLSENINLPNSLLSRFDLMFLILDVADAERDMALARHVTFVHKHNGTRRSVRRRAAAASAAGLDDGGGDGGDGGSAAMDLDVDGGGGAADVDDVDSAGERTLTTEVMREYIRRARQHSPAVPSTVAPYIVEAYVSLRKQDQGMLNDRGTTKKFGNTSNGDQTVMTARQLLSILRLSQSLARLRFSDYVATEDVDEAIRLTHMSKASLMDEGANGGGGSGVGGVGAKGSGAKGQEDIMSRIYGVIRDVSRSTGLSRVEVKTCEAMILRKGFTLEQLQRCLDEYQKLNVVQVNALGTHIEFVD